MEGIQDLYKQKDFNYLTYNDKCLTAPKNFIAFKDHYKGRLKIHSKNQKKNKKNLNRK